MRGLLPISLAVALAAGIVACGEKDEPDPAPPTVATGATGPSGEREPDGAREPGAAGEGGGGGGQASPREQVERAVESVVGGGEPDAVCQDLVTARYVKRAYGDEAGCRAAVATQPAFEVDVGTVKIAGARASARAKPRGGPNEGETITVELVEAGGAWKVDSALSNAPAGP